MENYIISLTTIPSKFDNLYKTMDSLIAQVIIPKKNNTSYTKNI